MFKITTSTSKQDILDYADNELGAKLNIDDTKAKLTEQVRELEKAAGIAVVDADDKQEVAKVETSKEPTKAEIIIHQPHSNDPEAEPESHWIGALNGRNYQIAFGEKVVVPYGVYIILKNAVETKYFTKKNPLTGKDETQSKKVDRFPHTLIRTID